MAGKLLASICKSLSKKSRTNCRNALQSSLHRLISLPAIKLRQRRRGLRFAGKHDQDHQRQHVGEHEQKLVGQLIALRLKLELQRVRGAEKNRSEENSGGLPSAEDDDRQRDEAAPGSHAFDERVRMRQREIRARCSGQAAAYQHAAQAQVGHVQARGVGGGGGFSRGANGEAEMGLIKNKPADRQQQQRKIQRRRLVGERAEERQEIQELDLHRREALHGQRAAGEAEDAAVEKSGEADGDEIDRRADDDLIAGHAHGEQRENPGHEQSGKYAGEQA